MYLHIDDQSLIVDRMKRKKRKKREFQSRQRQRQVQMLIQVDKNIACRTHSTQYAAASTRSRCECAAACISILKPCGFVLKWSARVRILKRNATSVRALPKLFHCAHQASWKAHFDNYAGRLWHFCCEAASGRYRTRSGILFAHTSSLSFTSGTPMAVCRARARTSK